MWGFVTFILGLLGKLFDKPDPKADEVIVANAPAAAAQAARAEQANADLSANVKAKEAESATVNDARAAGDAVRADGVQHRSDIYADDGFKRPDA